MILPQAPDAYDKQDQDRVRSALNTESKKALHAGDVFDKILMRDTATGEIKTVVITSGAFVIS